MSSRQDEGDRGVTDPGPIQRPVFFIHVMRTGGTSFREMLWENYPPESVYPNAEHFSEPPRHYPELSEAVAWLRNNPAPALVNGHYPYVLRSLLPPATLVATILRDPVDRSVSVLRRARRRNDRFRTMGYEAMFEDVRFRESHIENYQTKVFAIEDVDEIASVNLPLRMDVGRLEAALENLGSCEVVGVTRGFENAVRQAKAMGVPIGESVHTNQTPVADNDPFPNGLIERIRESVELDIELYQLALALSSR